ncbi:MAG: four helix bundle protein [Flavobacteriales bacterium]
MKHNFRELKIWQRGIELSVMIYEISNDFPSEERYGLCSQLRRASVSVPSNIAEGSSRNSQKEFIHYLSIASGSCAEVETQLEIAKRLGFVNEAQLATPLNETREIQKMIYSFSASIESKLLKKIKNQITDKLQIFIGFF